MTLYYTKNQSLTIIYKINNDKSKRINKSLNIYIYTYFNQAK